MLIIQFTVGLCEEKGRCLQKEQEWKLFHKIITLYISILVIWGKRLICGQGLLGPGILLLRRKHNPFIVLHAEI